ncbi:p53-induced death domain-containing protein 1 isoform X2 [Parambassis ranga]|uniref:P53-induced death domain-containing protein 1 isoform X2 n=1 Tax=Parambassis ranga TaxID=210632 RepID=A0A6P7KF90_9TELE|nr:p53-induced death domain-containing protein 1 isoform X2 [Parambassis ranga]
MEQRIKGETCLDEGDGEQAARWIEKPCSSVDGEEVVEVTSKRIASEGAYQDICTDNLVRRFCESLVNRDEEKSETGPTMSSGVVSEGHAEVVDPERNALSVSPSSLMMDTCDPSLLSLRQSSSPSSSSSSFSVLSLTPPLPPPLCLSPPLPPSVELSAVLTDTKLTLDVYQGGAAALPLLLRSTPGLSGLQYLKLGSEHRQGLDDALAVLHHLTELRSLAIRGHRFYDSQGDPLPGLLTTLPTTVSSLSHLVHLDLSFNQLSCVPSCLLSLPSLSYLLLCYNHLSDLPPDIGQLSSLTYFSLLGNKLATLPSSLGQLKALQQLDVSHNLLSQLPDEIGSLGELVKLELSHNNLTCLPESMGSLRSLKELVICSNGLRLIPHCLNKLPLLKIDVRDNPLGLPPMPPPLPPAWCSDTEDTKVPELHLGFNQHSFCVSSAGCHVFLPRGAELVFPRGCLVTTTRLKWAEKRPEKRLVQLEEHDILLSHPLELCPHGVTFLKPVEVCVPYHRKKGREVVVQRFDGWSSSTLPTHLKRGSSSHSSHPGGHPARLACCSVSHFSWFMAVGRLVKDSCSVTPAGAMLVSSSEPGVKLCFPPDSTVQTRTIGLQVLKVSVSEVQALCGDPQAKVGPLLCLTQTPSMPFLHPVKVQIPLPAGVTGHTVDMSCLHLLHGDPNGKTWTDITSQVSLSVTHLYAIFYITHFSWYWLWYTTKHCVSGVVRKVYQRLKQFKVQFLVLQRRIDPSQVLLQCLPADKCLHSLLHR